MGNAPMHFDLFPCRPKSDGGRQRKSEGRGEGRNPNRGEGAKERARGGEGRGEEV